jgi:hypothetical protein
MLWPRLRTEAATSVGGVARLPAIGVEDAVREAVGWGLQADAARRQIRDLLDRLRQVLDSGAVGVNTPALDLVSWRVRSM